MKIEMFGLVVTIVAGVLTTVVHTLKLGPLIKKTFCSLVSRVTAFEDYSQPTARSLDVKTSDNAMHIANDPLPETCKMDMVKVWTMNLSNGDSSIREKAVTELVHLRAVAPLTKALDSGDSTVREIAVRALAKLGAHQALVNALTSGDSTVRQIAADALVGKL